MLPIVSRKLQAKKPWNVPAITVVEVATVTRNSQNLAAHLDFVNSIDNPPSS